jgi:signal transduction histidine kinase/streptogramin lyase
MAGFDEKRKTNLGGTPPHSRNHAALATIVYREIFSVRFKYLLAVCLACRIAFGLDPGKALTQYAHRVWQQEQGLPQPTIYSVLQSHDGYLWLGTQGRLVRFDGVRFLEFAGSFGNDPIQVLFEDRQNNLWVGSGGSGLQRFSEGVFTSVAGLPDGNVNCITAGSDGSLWICTSKGLAKYSQGRFTVFTTAQGLPDNRIQAAVQAADGTLWVGGEDFGLVSWNGSRFVPAVNAQGRVRCLLATGSGTIWAGTGEGLVRYAGGRVDRWTTRNGLASDSILSLAEGRNGSIWIGTSAGVSRFENGAFTNFQAQDGLTHNGVLSVYEDREGSLWAGTKNGLNQFLDGSVTPYTAREGLPSSRGSQPATSSVTDEDHVVWTGTPGGGLRREQDGKVTVYSERDGLFDDHICATLLDDENNLWMASSKGIFHTSKRELDEFATGRRNSITSFPLSTGNVRFECRASVSPLAWRTADGKMWFSTDHGVIMVDPQSLRRDAQPPPIMIRDVTVNNRDTSSAELHSLRAGQNNLEFRYASLSFRAPERVTFRYFLEGYDKTWKDARSTRFASYTNLPPGDFRFRVTACNADGICNAEGSSVSFTIVPYFYQRRWFYAVAAAFVLGMAWLLYQLRIRRLEAQFTLVVAERTRIARELHDTLLQGLASITMQMQALSTRMASSPLKQNLDDIIHDAGTCLKESRKSLWGLRSPEPDAAQLGAKIAEMAREVTKGRRIRLKLNVDERFEALPMEVETHLTRIAQEALVNAVLHSGAGTIEVALRRELQGISLTIGDDGRGFVPDDPLPEGHYGLLGIRERVAEMSGNLDIESRPGKGTKLRVSIPIDGPHAPASTVNEHDQHSVR